MKRHEKFILYTVIGAIALGLVNLYCQGVPYGSNPAGFILAGFSVLVTILIGWQIYSVFSIRKEMSDFRRKYSQSISKLTQKHLQSKAHLHKSIMDANGRIALLDAETEKFIHYNWYEYLNSTLIALYYLYKAKNESDKRMAIDNFDAIWRGHHYSGVRVDRKTLNDILNNLNRLKGLIEEELYTKFDTVINEDIKVV